MRLQEKQLNLISKVFMTVIFLSIVHISMAQQEKIAITGDVKDASSGEPLIGVSTVVKGTTIGTVSDMNGKFSLEANTGDVLVFSYIGYVNQEYTVGSQSNISIALVSDLVGLDEVVVIGYGTQKKKLNTGATSHVGGEDLQKQSSSSALQAMQGMTPGVKITATSGQPGEGYKVTIRGLGTIGGAGPLYIVDGVVTDNINYLNNNDIESIDVLKDAASAAIYGSRAANGVILVTTKQGKKGKAQVTFDAYWGVQNVPNVIKMCDSAQYNEIMREKGFDIPEDGNPNTIANTMWMDEMFVKNAPTKNYTIGITGGSDISTYSTSLSYTGQEGIVGGAPFSYYDRYTGRFNSDHKLYNNKLTVGQHLNFTYTTGNGVGVGNQYNNSLREAFNASPWLPMYNEDGEYQDATPYSGIGGMANPYAIMDYNNQQIDNSQKLIGDIYGELELLKGLTFRTTFGIDYNVAGSHSYVPIYTLSALAMNTDTKISQYKSQGMKWTWANLLKYNLNFGDNQIDFMLGTQAESYTGSDISGTNSKAAFNDLEHAWLINATNTDGTMMVLSGNPYEDKLQSYFGRVMYNYKEKYMLNGTYRADGSSNFAEGNRWGYFPSVSAGWVISKESFMANTNQWMDFLKLRVSWGQNGNQNIPRFQYVSPIKFTDAKYNFGTVEGVNSNGSYPSQLPNANLKWETSQQGDIGFDARFFDSKLGVNFDIYNKTTKDWLVKAPVLAIAGADAPYINGGNVTNKGVELGLTYNDQVGEFHYSIGVNGAFNKNVVNEIPTADGIIHGGTGILYDNSTEFYRAEDGHAIGYFWGYKTNGIFQNQDEVNSYVNADGTLIQKDARPGDARFVDVNNDGTITSDDKTDVGDPNPDLTYGFNLSCDYKGFDFTLQANGVSGNQIVQSYRQINPYYNYTEYMYENRWHGEGTSNLYPSVNSKGKSAGFTDLMVHDGDFLRISNVTIGYNFSNLVKENFMERCRLYASVLNLYTFTKYNGMDPEVGYGETNGPQDSFSSGIDLGYYPHPRTVLLGVNVTF